MCEWTGEGTWRLCTVFLLQVSRVRGSWLLCPEEGLWKTENLVTGHWLRGNTRKTRSHNVLPREAYGRSCVMDLHSKLSQLEGTLEAKESIIFRHHWNRSLHGTFLSTTSLTPLSDFHLRFATGHEVPPQFWKGPWSIGVPTTALPHHSPPHFRNSTLLRVCAHSR